jgi:hypothetical protein
VGDTAYCDAYSVAEEYKGVRTTGCVLHPCGQRHLPPCSAGVVVAHN